MRGSGRPTSVRGPRWSQVEVHEKGLRFPVASITFMSVALKLFIFDLDGTLVDSSVDISNALNHAIRSYGISQVSVQETIGLIGEGLTRLIQKVIEQKAPGLDLMILVKSFTEYYSDHVADHTKSYPGTERVLKGLGGYKKAIVSNKTESLSVKVLQATELMEYFDYVAGGDTFAEKKPSPMPVFDVLSRFDARPEETLLVGDSIYDRSGPSRGRDNGGRLVRLRGPLLLGEGRLSHREH